MVGAKDSSSSGPNGIIRWKIPDRDRPRQSAAGGGDADRRLHTPDRCVGRQSHEVALPERLSGIGRVLTTSDQSKPISGRSPTAMTTTSLAPASPARPLEFEPYRDRSESELGERILAVKRELGDSLLILGHHYQQDEVIRFADLRGDSYKLSQLAAESRTCRAIVFCGVHFMAETADILSRDEVSVYLPDLAAGCSMADMADLESVEAAWEDLSEFIDTDDVMPVTYINSSADLKAFCGRHGGIVCTSSNARAVLEWAFARRRRVLFFPDQHLGRNTARTMGVPLDQMPVWNPREPLGGNTPEQITPAASSSGGAIARSTRCSSPSTSSCSAGDSPVAGSWSIPNA